MADKDPIIQAAADIAKNTSASAIIIMSADISFDIDTDIPVLLASPSSMMAGGPVLEAGYTKTDEDKAVERLQTLYNALYHRASEGVECIMDASAAAFINNLLSGDRVVGIVASGGTSSIIVHDLKDNPVTRELRACAERVNMNILRSVLLIAMDIGAYGREGKSVGTAFIIGDTEEVMKRSHQLVLNPYLGHPDEERYIRDPDVWETVKEFAQLDGMFILDSEGYIQSSGRYLDVDAREVEMVMGLGGRHASSATITRDTEAVAVTVSESDGTVRVYRDGIQVIELNPRASKVSRYS